MPDRKIQVSWTIDPDVVQRVHEYAVKLEDETGMKMSDSAVANAFLKLYLDQQPADRRPSKAQRERAGKS